MNLKKKLQFFMLKVVKDISQGINLDLIGFHGQTIYHNPQEKISLTTRNGKPTCLN